MISDWQPIETAPKGQKLLLSYPNGDVWIIIFTEEYKNYTNATHWMNLPKPPTNK